MAMMCNIALPTWSLQQPKQEERAICLQGIQFVLGIQLLHPAGAQGDNLARGEDNHGAQDA